MRMNQIEWTAWVINGQVLHLDEAVFSQGHPNNESECSASYLIQGGGYSMPELPLLDRDLVYDYLQVADQDAFECARLLAREEGIFGGFSAGANLAGALQLLRQRGKTITFLVCGSGLKYLSTDLY